MLTIEQLPPRPAAAALVGKQRDSLLMNAEERRWTRRRVRTGAGREVALALPTGSVLAPGAILALEPDWYLEVVAAPEALLAVELPERELAVRLAFEVGNLHFPLGMEGDWLLVPDDPAMVQLLKRLEMGWSRRSAPFQPIARAHAHER